MSACLPQNLKIGGLVKLTTLDYPGHLSAVIFCQGCPWRCRYCHNPHLLPTQNGTNSWKEIEAFLLKRKELLDAVVFSGGEPTAQKAIQQAVSCVKSMGFSVALHTAGIYPAQLDSLLSWVDWVGLDIKAPFEKYRMITGVKNSGDRVKESLEMLLKTKTPFECRTTLHPEMLLPEDIFFLGETLHAMGVANYHIQICRTDRVLDRTLSTQNNLLIYEAIWTRFKSHFPVFSVRHA